VLPTWRRVRSVGAAGQLAQGARDQLQRHRSEPDDSSIKSEWGIVVRDARQEPTVVRDARSSRANEPVKHIISRGDPSL